LASARGLEQIQIVESRSSDFRLFLDLAGPVAVDVLVGELQTKPKYDFQGIRVDLENFQTRICFTLTRLAG
jgi:hypothetical protein